MSVLRKGLFIINNTPTDINMLQKKITCNVLLIQWNARSINNKLSKLEQEIYEKDCKMICLQETFLTSHINKHQKFKNFIMRTLSREDRRGGKVATLVRDSLLVKSVIARQSVNCKVLTTEIMLSVDMDLTFGSYLCYKVSRGSLEEVQQEGFVIYKFYTRRAVSFL